MVKAIFVPHTYLPFLDDEDLFAAAQIVLTAFNRAVSKSDFEANSVDAFSAYFETALGGTSIKHWLQSERSRQKQKTLQNSVGTFHQFVLGSMPGCKDTGVNRGGVDVVNVRSAWIAEIKNKHNTVKGSDRKSVYDNLRHYIKLYSDEYSKKFTGYYVEVIPKGGRSYNEPFQPTDSLQSGRPRPLNKNIRIISGPQFYDLASESKGALLKLLLALPKIMKDKLGIEFVDSHRNLIALYESSFLGKKMNLNP